MTPVDERALRVVVYDEILNSGRVPTSVQLARHMGSSPEDVRAALASLRIGKTILVHPSTGEIWMAGPFSATETPYRVVGDGRSWSANCAWDMFGVVALAGGRAEVHTRCTDCDESITITAGPADVPNELGVVHFLLPARRWYDDIGFT
jgi:hypothetical protein